MTCEQRKDLLPLLLMDALEPAEAAAVRAHLAAGCPRCSANLAEADAALAYLPFALEPVPPAPQAREKLFKAIATPAPRPEAAPQARSLKMPPWLRVILPAAAAACVAVLITSHFMLQTINRQKSETAKALAQRDSNFKTVASQRDAATQMMNILTSKTVRQIFLEGRTQPKASARALWDPKRQAWHFFAYNLEQLGPKEAYELWFVTPYGRKIPANTFRPDELGNAHIVVTLPQDAGPVTAAMVTDEPSVGTFQPTGSTHLVGKLE